MNDDNVSSYLSIKKWRIVLNWNTHTYLVFNTYTGCTEYLKTNLVNYFAHELRDQAFIFVVVDLAVLGKEKMSFDIDCIENVSRYLLIKSDVCFWIDEHTHLVII